LHCNFFRGKFLGFPLRPWRAAARDISRPRSVVELKQLQAAPNDQRYDAGQKDAEGYKLTDWMIGGRKV
jgi:hypothetical protein